MGEVVQMMDWNLNTAESQDQDWPAKEPVSMAEAISKFRDAIASAGYGAPDIIPDGTIQRFELEGGKPGNKAGWYVLFLDEIPAGSFGTFRDDSCESWCAYLNREVSPEDWALVEKKMEQARAMRQAQKEKEQAKKAQRAQTLAASLGPATDDHPYLTRKGVPALPGVLLDDEDIILPLHDENGVIWSTQRIYPAMPADGVDKRVVGKQQGCFFHIGGSLEKIYISEGYATAATVHLATGCMSIMGINAGNLKYVAQAVRDTYPGAAIVIAADNDRFTKKPDGTPWNPGVEAAKKAAAEVGGQTIIPEFKTLDATPTDFNDLMLLEGLDEVKRQLGLKTCQIEILDWGMDTFSGEAPAQEWLVRDTIPAFVPGLFTAQGDTGKGYKTLDLGLQISGGATSTLVEGGGWFGRSVEMEGSTVILTAEDSQDEVHRRLNSLDPDGSRRHRAKGKLFIVPLPNSGGPIQLASITKGQPQATPMFHEIHRQLVKIKDLAMVNFDPLASFCTADINADPGMAAFLCGLLASMSEDLKTSILVAHHMKKGREDINSPEQARDNIRGTTALVDGTRFSLAMWPVGTNKAKSICKMCNTEFKHNKVYEGAVVKSNGPADRDVRTFVRNDAGLLVCRDVRLMETKPKRDDLLTSLEDTIRQFAEAGAPMQTSGQASVWARKGMLGTQLQGKTKGELEGLVDDLIAAKRVVRCTAGKSQDKYLDVPGGEYAMGIATNIEPGAMEKDND